MTNVRALRARHFRNPLTRDLSDAEFTTFALLLACLLILLTSAPTLARTISVPGNAPSIKGAMIQARAGDIILVSCGIYREYDIQVKPGISLWSGTLQPDCVTIDAGGQGRCLIFSDADSTTQVVGFTLRNGRATAPDGAGGAVLCEDSAPRITRCRFVDNSATDGGALAVRGTQGPLLVQSRFAGNLATRSGGAIHWAGQTGALRNCALVDNHALIAGGGLAGQGGSLTIQNSLIQKNSAGNMGGGLSLQGTAAILTHTIIAQNTGGLAGGGLECSQCSPVLKYCTFYANEADGDGTVLSLNESTPTLEACLITNSLNNLVTTVQSTPRIRYSNIFGTFGTQWPGVLAQHQAADGNLSVDPQYCDPTAGDYHLQAGSPCLPTSATTQIGALGQGCGAQFPPDVVD